MFLTSLKNSITNYNEYVEYVKANVMEADLVIWDDIAAKTGSEFEINQLLSYIEGRLTRGKANIFTSNLNRNEISANLGPRLASRICNMSTDIELKGADKRFFNIQSTNV
jgi:DNA replication protein DnaC